MVEIWLPLLFLFDQVVFFSTGLRISSSQGETSGEESSETGRISSGQGTGFQTLGPGFRQEPVEAAEAGHPGQAQQAVLELHHHLRLQEVFHRALHHHAQHEVQNQVRPDDLGSFCSRELS